MANPFLMTEEELSPPANDQYSNPFLMESNDEEPENPFISQGVCNPFSDFVVDGGLPNPVETTLVSEMAGFPMNVVPPTVLMDAASTTSVAHSKKKPDDIDSAMSFFGTTISDQDDLEDSNNSTKNEAEQSNVNIMAYSDDDAFEDHRMRRQSVPPSRTTQDLILSVSDQLDQNSSHLLDRIPVTRTPSPVSMRDLHSPSPTPGFDDLLDITDELPDDEHQSTMHPMPLSSDNPFATVAEPDIIPTPKVEPARPPPPRPIPPRPTPPRRPSPPQVVAAPQRPPARPTPPQTEVDLFDMFGSEAPPETKKAAAPKSNQDILNLFSVGTAVAVAAAPSPNADLLCDDIIPMVDNSKGDVGYGDQDIIVDQPMQSPNLVQSPEAGPPSADEPLYPQKNVSQNVEKDGEEKIASPKVTSPFVEEENISEDASVTNPETTGSSPISQGNQPVATPCFMEATPYLNTGDEQMDTTCDSVLATPSPSVNPFSSPDEDNEVVPISVPVINTEEVLSFEPPVAPPAAPKADLFDAFAAKFDSVRKEEPNLLDGFGPPSGSVSTEFGN